MKMRLWRLIVIFVIALLLCVSQPFWLSFHILLSGSVAVGQTNDSNDSRKAEADRLLNQGLQKSQTGKFEAGLEFLQQALIIFREIQDKRGEGESLGTLGLVYYFQGKYPKSIDYIKQGLKIFQEIKYPLREGQSLGNLGLVNEALGNSSEALKNYQQALKIFQEIQNSREERIVLGNIGRAYNRRGNYSKAIEYQEKSLKIALEIKDPKGESAALSSLGLVYDNQGNYPKAIDYYLQSLKIDRETKDREGESRTLGNIGLIYDRLGDDPKAIEYHLQHLKIAQEIKDVQGELNALGNIGVAYYSLGEYSKAIEYHLRSLKIAQAIQDPRGGANAQGNLGLAYYSLGEYPKAIKYHLQSLSILQKIEDRAGEGAVMGNIGLVYRKLQDYPKAIEYNQRALKIAQEIKNFRREANALNNLGVAYYEQGNLLLAENTLFAGINVLERLRSRELKDSEKISIFEEQSKTYRILQQVLIAQNKNEAALEISERGRARALIDLLTSKTSASPEEKLSTLPNIQEIKQIAKSQNTTLIQYSRITDEFKESEFQSKESELYIWVIKPTGQITFCKVDLKPLWQKQNTSLEELVDNIRDSIGVRDRNIFVRTNSTPQNTTTKRAQFDIKVISSPDDDPSKDLQKLHEILIDPIADLLPTDPNERVIFIPQNELFLVPFPALKDAQGKYLIEKHTILTAPSIQVLGLTHERAKEVKLASVQNALVVGNPDMPSVAPKIGEETQPLSKLPGAEKEAIAIKPLLEENNLKTKLLTDKQATKAAVLELLPQAKIIHFATHGLFDNIQGLQSAIALAPSGKDNGLLTAEEILNLKPKLNADLVVLSACNTGRGRITGDGVIGLSRSLITAGTPSVIVSLWAVPDAPTAELMTEFYKNLLNKQKPLDKAQALRQAMLKFKDKPPKDWAAFTLIGESN